MHVSGIRDRQAILCATVVVPDFVCSRVAHPSIASCPPHSGDNMAKLAAAHPHGAAATFSRGLAGNAHHDRA